jgi:VanZ family protein
LKTKILSLIYILFLGAVIVVANLQGTNFFAFLRYLPFGDKIGHFFLMGTLSLLVNLVLQARTFRIGRVSLLLGSLIVSAVVLAEEFSQMFIGGRTFDSGDLLFDFAGIVVFGEAARWWLRRRVRRKNG